MRSDSAATFVLIIANSDDANCIGKIVNYSYASNGIYVSRMFRQMVIVWLISTFRNKEEHENQLRKLLEIWQLIVDSKSLMYVEATVSSIEKITINSDNRIEKLKSSEPCRKLEGSYKLRYC